MKISPDKILGGLREKNGGSIVYSEEIDAIIKELLDMEKKLTSTFIGDKYHTSECFRDFIEDISEVVYTEDGRMIVKKDKVRYLISKIDNITEYLNEINKTRVPILMPIDEMSELFQAVVIPLNKEAILPQYDELTKIDFLINSTTSAIRYQKSTTEDFNECYCIANLHWGNREFYGTFNKSECSMSFDGCFSSYEENQINVITKDGKIITKCSKVDNSYDNFMSLINNVEISPNKEKTRELWYQ